MQQRKNSADIARSPIRRELVDGNLAYDVVYFQDVASFFQGQADGFDIYTRTTDKLAFGDVPLEFIIYFFCNDKFVLVGIDCKDEYADMIMRIFKTRFGVPTQPNKYLDEYEWKDGNALITMKHDKFNKIVSISMSSREQYNIAMHFLDECSKTAQSDF